MACSRLPRVAAALLLYARAASGSNLPPVVLIPGITGSAIEVQLENAPMPHIWCQSNTHGQWLPVWLVPDQLLPLEKDCLLARVTLTYDALSDSYANLPGVRLRAAGPDSGYGAKLLYVYQFDAISGHLSSALGYTMGVDLLLAPYDWRLAGDSHSHATNGVGGFYTEFKGLIESAVERSGRKAVLVSHSLGCPTTLFFLHNFVSEDWLAAHVDSWVAISGPWLGSAVQMRTYLGGWNLELPAWLVPHDYLKKVQVNASSGVWLSPHAKAFDSMPIIMTPGRNYTAADLPALIKLVGEAAGGEQTLAIMRKPSSDLFSIQRPPPRVHVHNWYSTGMKTPERFEYESEISRGFDQDPARVLYGDGDGTVNLQSLQSVERFWPESEAISTKVFPKVSHFGILSDQRVLGAMEELLRGKMATVVV